MSYNYRNPVLDMSLVGFVLMQQLMTVYVKASVLLTWLRYSYEPVQDW